MWIHARFSPEIKDGSLEWIQKTPRYVVCREQATREHYHAVFESPVGVEAVKKRFQSQCKALGLVSKKGQENAYYGGVKEWTEDISYICKDGDFVSYAGYTKEELIELQKVGNDRFNSVPIVVGPGTVEQSQVVFLPKKSRSIRAQFVSHLKDIGWVANKTICPENHQSRIDMLIDELTDFSENAFTTPNGAVTIEHAKWVFADDEVKKMIYSKNREAIKKCLR